MVSPVDLCNLALISLGQPTVVQIDPPDSQSKSARLCGQIYEPLRDEIIRSHPWRRLTKRTTLAASVVAPDWGYTTAYPMPADLVRLIDVYVGDVKLMDWHLEGDDILTNTTAPLQIRYTRTSSNPDDWDPLLRDAIAYRLAVDLAEPLTQDPSKKSFAIAKYQEVMNLAKNASAQEGTPVDLGLPDRWVAARFGRVDDPLLRNIS